MEELASRFELAKKSAVSFMKQSSAEGGKQSGFNTKAALIGSASGLALFFAGYAALNASKKASKSEDEEAQAADHHTPLL